MHKRLSARGDFAYFLNDLEFRTHIIAACADPEAEAMKAIETTGSISRDGMLTARLPGSIPPGEHRVVIVIEEAVGKPEKKTGLDLPVHDFGPWPEGLSLRRENVYGDEGR